MANKSRRQMADTIRTIIDLSKRQGRLTTEQVASEFGISLDTARKCFQAAVATGEVIRYSRFDLFRDARSTIDFNLAKYDYWKSTGAAKMSIVKTHIGTVIMKDGPQQNLLHETASL